MYKPTEIADFYLSNHGDSGISPMKLIKLVYISHAWYLGLSGNALIDENPEAWKYGPVIPTLYHKYKNYGNRNIDYINVKSILDKEAPIGAFLEAIWNQYGHFSAVELSSKTHEPGSPWSQVWESITDGNYHSLQIPDTLIRDYYKDKYISRVQDVEIEA
ncbi:MAG: DUF4065 domain-containing protein [bacterium]|nr:DUF4065 domain-containing protein [bacterium]